MNSVSYSPAASAGLRSRAAALGRGRSDDFRRWEEEPRRDRSLGDEEKIDNLTLHSLGFAKLIS
uniref:Uncharacterized protein n=1 Tax=Arundo donax TaxID=35708 RepID=A0A0A9EQC4_ARUDO